MELVAVVGAEQMVPVEQVALIIQVMVAEERGPWQAQLEEKVEVEGS
jgi:hypothetical protein